MSGRVLAQQMVERFRAADPNIFINSDFSYCPVGKEKYSRVNNAISIFYYADTALTKRAPNEVAPAAMWESYFSSGGVYHTSRYDMAVEDDPLMGSAKRWLRCRTNVAPSPTVPCVFSPFYTYLRRDMCQDVMDACLYNNPLEETRRLTIEFDFKASEPGQYSLGVALGNIRASTIFSWQYPTDYAATEKPMTLRFTFTLPMGDLSSGQPGDWAYVRFYFCAGQSVSPATDQNKSIHGMVSDESNLNGVFTNPATQYRMITRASDNQWWLHAGARVAISEPKLVRGSVMPPIAKLPESTTKMKADCYNYLLIPGELAGMGFMSASAFLELGPFFGKINNTFLTLNGGLTVNIRHPPGASYPGTNPWRITTLSSLSLSREGLLYAVANLGTGYYNQYTGLAGEMTYDSPSFVGHVLISS